VRPKKDQDARADRDPKNLTCLITGANSGIGKAAAFGLAKMGAAVVLLCRDAVRGDAAVSEIKNKTGNKKVTLLLCDLASQKAIRSAADQFCRSHTALHVLINNAGLNCFQRTETVDGIECVFAVNYLAPFLLTNLLLKKLKAGAPSRIITVAGLYHTKAVLNFDDLEFKQDYSPTKAANQAQLAKIMMTYELARRLKDTGVTANCVHPGAVRTPLQKKLPWHWRLLTTPLRLFFRSPKNGTLPYLHLASSADVAGASGCYFNRMKKIRSSEASYDESAARRLWRISLKMCGRRDGEVSQLENS